MPLVPVQPFASVTLTVIGKLPVWVGVPESTPALESVIPVGRVPLASVKVSGVWLPPVPTVKFWLKAEV